VALQRVCQASDAGGLERAIEGDAVGRVGGGVEVERGPAETARVGGDDGADGGDEGGGVERGGFDVGVAGEEVVAGVVVRVGYGTEGAEEVVFGVDEGGVVGGDGGRGVDADLGEEYGCCGVGKVFRGRLRPVGGEEGVGDGAGCGCHHLETTPRRRWQVTPAAREVGRSGECSSGKEATYLQKQWQWRDLTQ